MPDLFWNYFGTIWELFWNYFGMGQKTTKTLFWNYFGTIGTGRNYFGTILELCGNCGIWSELFWNYFGTILELFRNYLDRFCWIHQFSGFHEFGTILELPKTARIGRNYFGTILELFWNYFGTICHGWNYFGTILELLSHGGFLW